MEQLLVKQPRAISIDRFSQQSFQQFYCHHVNIRWQQTPVHKHRAGVQNTEPGWQLSNIKPFKLQIQFWSVPGAEEPWELLLQKKQKAKPNTKIVLKRTSSIIQGQAFLKQRTVLKEPQMEIQGHQVIYWHHRSFVTTYSSLHGCLCFLPPAPHPPPAKIMSLCNSYNYPALWHYLLEF